MRKFSNQPVESPEDGREHREKFARAFDLYLCARGGDTANPVWGNTNPRCEGRSTNRFDLLSEAEAAARHALEAHFSERVYVDFLIAILQSVADTTARFKNANAVDAPGFCALAKGLLWDGLSELKSGELCTVE
jgi:hypothetical protein